MKNNLSTKIITILMLILILITVNTTIFAAENNYSLAMALSSSSKLKEGDTVTIKVNLTSINAGDGIDTITAKINYDENVFETLTSADITAGTNWNPSYASSTKMITLQKSEKVTKPENVLTINLKVKSTISVSSTTVTLQEIVASGGRVVDGGTGDIEVNSASVTINKDNEAITNIDSNTNTNTSTNTNTVKNTTVKDNTVTQTATLPKTGIEQYGIIAIVVMSILAIFSYALYKKISKEVK